VPQATADRRKRLEAILRRGPVIPVVTIADAAHAVPLARALLEGGIAVVEVTLRTPAATEAIRRIRAEVPAILVGAGTVLSPAQLEQVDKLDVAFAVSPGATVRLLEAARASPVPLLPGVATASEAMAVLESGFTLAKLFPAEPAGGVALLKALAGPLPELRFCPTGGIDAGNAAAYLRLSNVLCVGGSWLAPADAIAAGDWRRITALARAASELGGGAR
jgi:2-dehydro-3-deoxyphosphogluconate aldolase/(4S)-4-hydroxy-2-oxoglutarate aldolase